MGGVVAAGSEIAASTGAQILNSGGNAVSAAVAACFAATVGEPAIASLSGGGVLLFYNAETGKTVAWDFFANIPEFSSSNSKNLDFFPVNIKFGEAEQEFHIGRGAACYGGGLAGLCSFSDDWGNLPLKDIIAPTLDALEKGIYLQPEQRKAVTMLQPILQHSMKQGSIDLACKNHPLKMPFFAETLLQLTERSWRDYYENVYLPYLLEEFSPANGGLITPADIKNYQLYKSKPIDFSLASSRIMTIPTPAKGGELISLVSSLYQEKKENKLSDITTYLNALKVAEVLRCEAMGENLLNPTLYAKACLLMDKAKEEPLGDSPGTPQGNGSTTHISVLDASGNAVGVTFSHGEGCGYRLGDTGISMNNLLGEEDLSPQGFHQHKQGGRLQTMMSPTIVHGPRGEINVLGSGGANRIRTAIGQVLHRLVYDKASPKEAVEAPRVHFEKGHLYVELVDEYFSKKDFFTSLSPDQLTCFHEKNLFFGGVNLVQRDANGKLSGYGDPRRGGHCIVVP